MSDIDLLKAIEERNPSLVRRLLEAGADPNKPNARGETPLMVAVRGDYPVETRMLLEFGADPNYLHEGWTPLRCAAFNRNEPTVRILLAAGALVPAESEDWATELDAFARELTAA